MQENIEAIEEEFLKTHNKIPGELFGRVVDIKKGYAKVTLVTKEEMKADEMGLLNAGIIFASAFLAAMASVNDPNTAPLSADIEFLAPVKVGDILHFEAYEKYQKGKRREIDVIGTIDGIKVFKGVFIALVFEEHVLKSKLPKYQ